MPDTIEVVDHNNDRLSEVGTGKFTAKVFGYMGIGLAITAVVAFLLNILFSNVFPIVGDGDVVNEQYFMTYLIIFIVSMIALFITSFVVHFAALFRTGKAVMAPYIVYAVLMGVMMSALTIFVPGYIIGITLGITTLTFAAMFFIGYFAKGNMSTLAMVASGLAIGAFMIVMFNLILYWFFPVYATMATWLASGIIFIAMMLFIIIDIHRVKEIAKSGYASENLALYCAFNLYVDFIYLFIRILRIVILLFGNSRK